MNYKLIDKAIYWLGSDGIKMFEDWKDEYGTVSPILFTKSIPHSVHSSEGMQVRNWMREQEEIKDIPNAWLDLDSLWIELIEEVIIEQKIRKRDSKIDKIINEKC